MDVLLGVTPLLWNSVPESLESYFTQAASIGFKGIEWGSFFPQTPSEVLTLLQQHRLQLSSACYESQLLVHSIFDELNRFDKHLQLLKTYRCKVVVFCDTSHAVHNIEKTPLSQRPLLTEQAWKTLIPRIQTMAHMAAKHGIKTAYYPHIGTAVQNAQDIQRLLSHTDDTLTLLLNPAHLLYAGSDPVKVTHAWAHRITYIHAQDLSESYEETLPENTCFADLHTERMLVAPLQGVVDYRSVFQALASVRYKGWCMVDISETLQSTHHTLTSFLRKPIYSR